MKELVLYYTPENTANTAKLKGVLVSMGVRIKNIAPGQTLQTVGSLAGVDGFETRRIPEDVPVPVIGEEVLVMHRFSSARIDELLKNLKKAGVPKINLKAVVTQSNCPWTFNQLYEELRKEHEKLQNPD